MLRPVDILKANRAAGAANSLFAPHRFIDEHVLLTKLGHLGVAVKIAGIDPGCLTDAMLESHVASLLAAFRSFDDQFRIYQYLVKSSGARVDRSESYADDRVGATVAERVRSIESRSPYSVDLYMVFVYEPAVFGKKQGKQSLSSRKTLRILAAKLEANRDYLVRKVEAFVAETKDLLAARILAKPEFFSFLRLLVNLDPALADSTPLLRVGAVDCLACDQELKINRGGTIQVGERHVEVLTVKDPPTGTRPDLFGELCAIDADFVACFEMKTIPTREAKQLIGSAESHFHFNQFLKNPATLLAMLWNRFTGEDERKDIVSDKAALSDVGELGNLSVALNKNDELGQFSGTLVFHGVDRGRLRQASSEAVRIFGRAESSVFREGYNALGAYLSIIPGNSPYGLRRLWMLRSSFADMSLVFAAGAGEKNNAHLGQEYLVAVETTDHTIHYLNLHNEDVLGVFATGKTGAGKSIFCNAVLDNIQKYNPFTLILDAGGSYRMLCRKYGGAYMSVGDLSFSINPFILDPGPQTYRFLAAFIRILLANEGYQGSYTDGRHIFEAVSDVYSRRRDDRRLSNLKLPKHLKEPLYRWTGRGEFGSVFDNVEDNITLSDFKVFDFQGIEGLPEVAEPLFFYLFMRFNQVVQDPALATRLKILHLDELHRFFEHSTCRKQVVRAGKMFRKHNAGIIMATQSAFDLKNVGLMEIISEVTPTKILLANPSADMNAYKEMFHMNDQELAVFRKLISKRQFMVKKEERPAQVLELNLSPYELEQYRNDPFGVARRDAAFAKHGFADGMKVLTGEIQ